MNRFTTLLIFLFSSHLLLAQYQIGLVPRISPDRTTSQKIGFTEVEITYGSPAINNRQIWGELVAYDEVWRAGANNATTVYFSSDVVINETKVDSGKYALFIIPKANSAWTIILNNVSKQWGSFQYNKKEDALRLDVAPNKMFIHFENLTYSIRQVGFEHGSIVLNWGFIELNIPFKTNYLNKFEAEVEERAKKQPDYVKWVVYVQGADHLATTNSNGPLALLWINKAENIMNITTQWNDQFYPRDYVVGHLYWTKAKLLATSNKFNEAVDTANKLTSLKNKLFYNRKNKVEKIDELIKVWREE